MRAGKTETRFAEEKDYECTGNLRRVRFQVAPDHSASFPGTRADIRAVSIEGFVNETPPLAAPISNERFSFDVPGPTDCDLAAGTRRPRCIRMHLSEHVPCVCCTGRCVCGALCNRWYN